MSSGRCTALCIAALGTAALGNGLAGDPLAAQDSGAATIRGPVIVGNGLLDGPGATLGRFFVLLHRSSAFPEEDGGPPVPLELHFTSNIVTVEPTTCSRPDEGPCVTRGRGLAGVAGLPTEILGGLMSLKLASAFYLAPSDRYQNGSSLEVAMEGSLYAGVRSPVGDAADLRLFAANPAYLLDWGADEFRPVAERQYRQNTGAAVLLGDSHYSPFPGWLRGRVAANDGNALTVEFTQAEILATQARKETRIWLAPDYERAREAGLGEGVFGHIEVNYSGKGTLSHIVPGAATHDTELRVTAIPVRGAFLRGDCNGDGLVTGALTDAIVLLQYSFVSGAKPPCLAACDADGSGNAGGAVADAIYLLHFMFFGGPAPPAPYPVCGLDPEPPAHDEGCETPSCL